MNRSSSPFHLYTWQHDHDHDEDGGDGDDDDGGEQGRDEVCHDAGDGGGYTLYCTPGI